MLVPFVAVCCVWRVVFLMFSGSYTECYPSILSFLTIKTDLNMTVLRIISLV